VGDLMASRLTDEQRRFRATSEDELLTAVLQWADLRGWLIHHDRRSDRAIQQGDRGFPDLVLARYPRVLFVELKAETGKATTEQMAWILAIAGQRPEERLPVHPEVFLWRPSDLDRAIETLR
jgi:hypothetical protein